MLDASVNISATTLTQVFLKNYPREAVRKLEGLNFE
jgi:hypothetical protein